MSSATPSPFTRPAYPSLQSTTVTSSTSSCSSLSSLATSSSSSAPMPSPSAQQPQQGFFGSIRPQQQQLSYNQTQPAHQQQFSASEQRQAAYNYRPNREGAGRTNGETKNLLSEYALIAEAAKRAQMAVLMRDMEGVEL